MKISQLVKKCAHIVVSWFDASARKIDATTADKIDWARIIPFIAMHLAALTVFWVGFSWIALAVAIFLYAIRIFSIGAFYHRYFSHRTFRTSRVAQFIFGVIGASSVQRGPIWWSSHHRFHHAVSDQPEDPHSMKQHGFLWSHMGWFLSRKYYSTDDKRVQDWLRYPELRLLDRFDILVPVLLAVGLFFLGQLLASYAPQLGTNGWQMLVWGFFVSTVAMFHATVSINSITHKFGKKRFQTSDESRNSWYLALLTFGEGWHNNHHHYPYSARNGFYWWEIDINYYGLKVLEKLGLIWDLKPVPKEILEQGRNL